MAFRKVIGRALPFLLAAGCALYTDVSIAPLMIMPTSIDRGSDVASMVKKSDYLRAIELTSLVEGRPRKSAQELAALGEAELASGRFDAARHHLRAALDLEPVRSSYAQIAWNLAQVEYMRNNYEASLDWAQMAINHGLNVKQWHVEYLRSLAATQVYRFTGLPSDRLPLKIGRPDVPRVDVRINRHTTINAVVDSGAVLCIASQRAASSLSLRRLGKYEGTFYGLLGEPIQVQFAL